LHASVADKDRPIARGGRLGHDFSGDSRLLANCSDYEARGKRRDLVKR
jgi:hypothetical protein